MEGGLLAESSMAEEISNIVTDEATLHSVREYYGKILKTKNDLKTTACCPTGTYPKSIRDILELIHPEVIEKSYGCGIPIPPLLDGCTVLDLGSGAGRDAFILSKLVGPEGQVIGVDMTPEQIAVAKEHQEYHAQALGLEKTNISFHKGLMEDLATLGIEDDSIDVIISNCVFNLSPSKKHLFREVFRVLRPGGELFFSDVFVDRRLASEVQADPVLLGECLGGAMYLEDFRRLLCELGIRDFRVVSRAPIDITDGDVRKKLGHAQFTSVTIRAFKLNLEDRCEDYGQAVKYTGTIEGHSHSFALDSHHFFEAGKVVAVCGNTADMLRSTRYSEHFEILGDGVTHYGIFPCQEPSVGDSSDSSSPPCC